MPHQRGEHRPPEPAAARLRVDGERDRPGETVAAGRDEGAAVDVAERRAVRAREVAEGPGLHRAAELPADGVGAQREHARRPLRAAEVAAGLRIPEPRRDDGQVVGGERGQAYVNAVTRATPAADRAN